MLKMCEARQLTQQLRGRWHGQYGTAPCPICQVQGRKDQNALTLADGADGRLLLHCKKSHCAFRDLLAAVGITRDNFAPLDPEDLEVRRAQRASEIEKKSRQAQHIWQETLPINGTVAETYLRETRGITCALPPTLRFHPTCWHKSGHRLAAMVALVEGGNGFATHRTYLRADGSGKAAVEPNKAMLGSVAGGAVRLAEAQERLVVAEGIETALSLCCGLLRAPAMVWAALSTSGLKRLRLPSTPKKLIVAPDGDLAGRRAAHDLAERAQALGWQVSLLPAPEGHDWNDILKKEGEPNDCA